MDQVLETMRIAHNKFPSRRVVVLGGQELENLGLNVIRIDRETPASLNSLDVDQTVFVYASEQDDFGVPFIRLIIKKGGKYIPVGNIGPSNYINQDFIAREVIAKESLKQTNEGFYKADTGPGDFINLMQALYVTRSLVGDYLEIGCYEGSSAGIVLRYLGDKVIPRRCFFLDVFSGFNYEAASTSADIIWQGSHTSSGIDNVTRRLAAYENHEIGVTSTVIKSNIITDDIPSDIKDVVVANIDVDLYEAVYAGLCKVAPLICLGGIMIAEDAGHTPFLIGARTAVLDFLMSEIANDFVPVYMESGQTWFVRCRCTPR